MSFGPDEESRQAAREAAVKDMPPEIRAHCELDASIYGNGYAERMPDGTWRRVDPTQIAVFAVKGGTEVLYGAARLSPDGEKLRQLAERLLANRVARGQRCGSCVHRKTAGSCEEFPYELIDAHDGVECPRYQAGDGFDPKWTDRNANLLRRRRELFRTDYTMDVDGRTWWKRRSHPHEMAHIVSVADDGVLVKLCVGIPIGDLRGWKCLTDVGVELLETCPVCKERLK